jgi:hypothetical protein
MKDEKAKKKTLPQKTGKQNRATRDEGKKVERRFEQSDRLPTNDLWKLVGLQFKGDSVGRTRVRTDGLSLVQTQWKACPEIGSLCAKRSDWLSTFLLLRDRRRSVEIWNKRKGRYIRKPKKGGSSQSKCATVGRYFLAC